MQQEPSNQNLATELLGPDLDTGGHWLWRALQARLRFVVAIVIMAGLAAAWPWLQAGWDQLLVAWSGSNREPTISSSTEFFCPMDAGVVSAWPSICPICNMDLIARKKGDTVVLPDGALARMQISPYRIQFAGVQTAVVRAGHDDGMNMPSESNEQMVRVPASSVVHHGGLQLVYRSVMPDMFDAIPVNEIARDGEDLLVKGPLEPGQAIVAQGAFLVDAESRLNPSISAQYFGANRTDTVTSHVPTVKRPSGMEDMLASKTLSPEEQSIVDHQKLCPVTKAALGSMGKPIFVTAHGRTVALCCAGCRDSFQRTSEKHLEWLDQQMASHAQP